jgi:hypothetical protein
MTIMPIAGGVRNRQMNSDTVLNVLLSHSQRWVLLISNNACGTKFYPIATALPSCAYPTPSVASMVLRQRLGVK